MIKETLQVDTNIKEVTEAVDKLIEKLKEANSLADDLAGKTQIHVKLGSKTFTCSLTDSSILNSVLKSPRQIVTETDDQLFIDDFPVEFVSNVKVEPFGDKKKVSIEFMAKDYIDNKSNRR